MNSSNPNPQPHPGAAAPDFPYDFPASAAANMTSAADVKSGPAAHAAARPAHHWLTAPWPMPATDEQSARRRENRTAMMSAGMFLTFGICAAILFGQFTGSLGIGIAMLVCFGLFAWIFVGARVAAWYAVLCAGLALALPLITWGFALLMSGVQTILN